MKTTLEMVNKMQADGIIGKYAIGGAVGATFYLEPAATMDVDIFVMLPTVGESALLTLGKVIVDKQARRKELAALPFSEKLKNLKEASGTKSGYRPQWVEAQDRGKLLGSRPDGESKLTRVNERQVRIENVLVVSGRLRSWHV